MGYYLDLYNAVQAKTRANTMSEQETPHGNIPKEVYEKYLHQSELFSDTEWWGNSLKGQIIHDLWQAVKAAQGISTRPPKLPPPSPGHEAVTPRLKEMLLPLLEQREQEGIGTYGRSLETFNGRPAWTDLSQELIDAMQYGLQLEMERQALAGWLKEAVKLAYEAIEEVWAHVPDHSKRHHFLDRLKDLQGKTKMIH